MVERILEAATQVLASQGYPAMSTNRVAEAAGVSVGSLYRYFSDKQEIFETLRLRASDAIWIISEGVVAADVADGILEILPVETGDTSGPAGLTGRADTPPSLPLSLLMQAIREAAGELRDGRTEG